MLVGAAGLCAAVAWLSGTGLDARSAGRDGFVVLPAASGPMAPGQVRATGTPPLGDAGSGRRFAESVTLVPRAGGVAAAGFVITAASEAATLARHRLRAGDVLLAVDGQPLHSARIRTLGDELAGFDAVEVSYERAGQVRKRLLTFD